MCGHSRNRSVGPGGGRAPRTILGVQTDELRPGPKPAGSATFVEAARLLRTAALARAIDEPDCADRIVPLLQGRFAVRSHTVDVAADAAIREAAHEVLTHGWRPTEVHTFAARRLDPVALGFLVDALASTAQWTVAPPWLGELNALSARVWWTAGHPHITQWSARHGRRRAETLRVAVDVLAVLSYLPRTDRPQPGMPPRIELAPEARIDDDRIAGRIDALLARATGSDHPGEAAACAAKAQDLMVRYATTPAVRRSVLRDPRRVVAAVGAEVAGLIHRAAAAFAARPRPAPIAELTQAPNGRSW